ncbi:MAG: DUF1549 and DUF1553 domain-containing protein [Gemmataceae bacterium]
MRFSLLAVLLFTTPVVAEEKHWAFQPVTRPANRHSIDSFFPAPRPEASRTVLIRRVTFDLTGLPPTPDEVDAFLKDESPDAYGKLIDRLLASPRYGERQGRHWLDLARYADTNGYEFDEPRPDAWRYRDYVIKSFNDDKPFDRFILEQLAGDEAFPGNRDALIATGFNLLGPDMTDSSDQLQRRHNTLNDMTDTAALAFLGLTMGCARCHDHKFEPIPQADYFRMQAFFQSAAFRKDLPVITPEEQAARMKAQADYDESTKVFFQRIARVELPHRTKLYDAKLAKLSAEAQAAHRTDADKRTGGQQELVRDTQRLVNVSDTEVAKLLTEDEKEQVRALNAMIAGFASKKPPPAPVAMGLAASEKPERTFILERGELTNRGAEVNPGFPRILSGGAVKDAPGGRLALAKWIASKDNPLTARVIVNRLWQHHFGEGLVRTPSDFGLRGARPTNPELLDWLAAELTAPADGRPWALKRMHKLMLMSNAYRAVRSKPMRLEGEAVRDSLLAISGTLNFRAGGPGVVLPEASAAAGGSRAVPATADIAEHARRSVYLFSRRNLRLPFLEAFDLPDSNMSCPKREKSTIAPQALSLLNSPEVMRAATALSGRLMKEAKTDSERIDLAWRLALGRPPTDAERTRAAKFLQDSPLNELCRGLFNLNEFVYVD